TLGVSDQPIEPARPLPAFDTTITGAINYISDVDDYTFAATAGQVVTVERRSGTHVDLSLLGPAGDVVAGIGNTTVLIDRFALPEDGTYTVRIESNGNGVSGEVDDTGAYSFAVLLPVVDPVPVPIEFGTMTAGSIEVRGGRAAFTFEVGPAEVNRPVSITVSPPPDPFGQVVTLLRPDGSQLAQSSTNRAFNVWAVEIDSVVLPDEGTYTIRVSDSGNDNTGAFVVGLSDQPIEAPTPLEIGSRTAGFIGYVADVDEYTISSSTGETVSIAVQSDSGFSVELTVLDPTGATVRTVTGSDNPSTSFTPQVGLTYTVRIEPRGGTVDQRLDDRGIYQIDISDASRPAVYPVDDGAVVPLAPGQTVEQTIDTAGDVDAYAFEGLRGQRVRIAVAVGRNGSGNNALSADLRLVGPGGVTLFNQTSGSEQDVQNYLLPADGTYRIEVSGGGTVGPYVLGLSDRPVEEAAPVVLTSGDGIVGNLQPLVDEDVCTFTYTDGDLVDLSFFGGPDGQMQVRVVNPIGTTFTTLTGSSVSLIGSTLPTSGDYRVVVTRSGRTTGAYLGSFAMRPAGSTLPAGTLEGEPPAAVTGRVDAFDVTPPIVAGEAAVSVPPLPAIVSGFDDAGSTPLTFGEAIVGQFTEDAGRQVFEFFASAGEIVHLDVEATTQFDANLELRDPDGVLLGSSTGGANAALVRSTPKDGTYQAIVTGSGNGGFVIGGTLRTAAPTRAITLDGPTLTDVIDAPADQHRYIFDLVTATTIDLVMSPVNGSLLDTTLRLYSPAGRQITSTSSSGAATFDNLHLLETGQYVIVVSARLPVGAGGYGITLSTGTPTTITPNPIGAVGFGETVAGSIDNAGDAYELSLVVGATEVGSPVSIVVTAPPDPFGQILELFGPDNVRIGVVSSNRSFGVWAVELDDVYLPVEGTYTIRVRETGDNDTGAFTIGVSDQPVEPPTPIAGFNQVIGGTIDFVGDVDGFTFAGLAGQVVTVERVSGGSADVTLYRPDGSVLAGGGVNDTRLHLVTLPEDGTYSVRVEARNGPVNSEVDDTGAYSFVVWNANRSPVPIPIGFGETQQGVFAAEGDLVDFSLAVSAGQVGSSMSIVATAPPDPFGQIVELFDPSGARIAVQSTNRAFGVWAVELDDVGLPVEGDYLIRVRDSGDDNTGTFTLGVSDQPIEPPTPIAGFNQVISGAIDFVGDVDDFTFTGAAGQLVTIERNSGSSAEVTLYGPNGSIVAGGGVNDTRLHLVTLPDGGTYSVRVEAKNGPISGEVDDTGAYSFTVWDVTRDAPPIPIGFGETQQGTWVAEGDYVTFSLDVQPGQAGAIASFVVTPPPDPAGQIVELFDPTGARIAVQSTNRAFGVWAVELDDILLPVEGEYLVRVRETNDDQIGTFTLGVSDQPIETPAPIAGFNQAIGGAIDFIGDVDEFTFAGIPGQIVTVERNSGSHVDLTLFGPDGSVVSGGGVNDTRLHLVTLSDNGTHTVRVEPRNGPINNEPDNVGAYSFTVWDVTRDAAPIPIGFGDTRDSALVTEGDYVTFSFAVLPEHIGSRVSIAASPMPDPAGQIVELFAPNGTRIAVNSTSRAFASWTVELDDVALPVEGEYLIRVRETNDDHSGTFTLGVSDQPIPAGTEPITDDNVPLSRRIDPFADVDRFTFDALQGEAFTVVVDAAGSLNVDAAILDSSGFARAAVSSGSDATISNFVAPADDTYTIRVEPGGSTVSNEAGRTGDYTIRLERIIVAPNLAVADVTVPGAGLQSGDLASFSFTVENTGNAPTGAADWSDRVVLSTNAQYGDGDDVPLGVFPRSGALEPGETYTANVDATIPDGVNGDFFLIVETDSGNQVLELFGETDNVTSSTATFRIDAAPYPDLVVEDLAVQVDPTVIDAGNALEFDGDDDLVAFSDALGNFGSADFTVAFFVRAQADGVTRYLLGKRGTCGHSSFWNIGYNGTGTVFVELDPDVSGSLYHAFGTQSVVADGAWHHVALVRSGATASLYVDGDLDTQSVGAGTANLDNTAPLLLADNVCVGQNGTERAAGQIDELRLWNEVRTEPQIESEMNRPLTGDETGLVGYFRFDQDSGQAAIDDSSAGLDGVLGGGVTSAMPQRVASTAPIAVASPTPSLLSAGKPVTGSGFFNSGSETFPFDNVTDGRINDTGTGFDWSFWLTQGGTNDHVVIDLEDVVRIDAFRIQNTHNRSHHDRGTRDFRIEVSEDGVSYTTVVDDTLADVNGAEFPFETFSLAQAVTGRFVRFQVDSFRGFGGGLNEIEVYGGSGATTLTGHRVTWTTANRGDLDALGGFDERVTVTNLTTGAQVINAVLGVPDDLAAGATLDNMFTFNAVTPGRYRVQVTTDAGDAFFEFNAGGHDAAEQNNSSETEFVIDGPDLVVTDVTAPAGLIVGDPAEVPVTWTVRNDGPATGIVGSWIDRVYLSTDDVVGNGDEVAVGEATRIGRLDPGADYTANLTVTLPTGLTGRFHLYVVTDDDSSAPEPDGEDNNASSTVPIEVAVPWADLGVEAVAVTPSAALSGRPVTVTWRVRNTGTGTTNVNSWVDRIVLSADDVLDAGDTELGTFVRSGALGVDGNYTAESTLNLPEGVEGAFHVFVIADSGEQVYEFDFEDNNAGRTVNPIQVTRVPDPDLVVADVASPAGANPGESFNVQFTVENVGEGDAAASWVDRVYVSPDGTPTGATLLATVPRDADLAGHGGAGGVGASYQVEVEVVAPALADGDYRIVVVTDDENAVFEDLPGGAGEANNLLVSSQVLSITHPDLVPVIDNVPANATSGDTVPVTFTVTNEGTGTAPGPGSWIDRVYLSEDTQVDAGDRLLAERVEPGPLAPLADYEVTLDLPLPIDVSGTRFIIVVTDDDDEVQETADEDNNVVSSVVEIALAPFADLVVSNILGPPLSVGDPITITVDWTLSNIGTGPGLADTWVERIVASTDDVFGDGDDRLLAEVTHTGLIATTDEVERSHTFRLPPAFSGRYVLYVQTDATGAVFENGSEANNVARMPGDFDVVLQPYADLVVESVATDAVGASGQPFGVSWRVRNDPANAIGQTSTSSWNDRVQLATNPDGTGVVATYSFNHVGVLAVDGFYDRAATLTLPNGISGTFYAKVITGGPFEFVFTDNNDAVSGPFEVTLTPPPNLTVTDIVVPTQPVTSGTRIDLFWTVRNQGPGDAFGSWTDTVRLVEVGGGSPSINLGTLTFTAPQGGLQAGTTYTRQEQFTLPVNASGVYRAEVITNSNGALFEPERGDNTVLDDASLQIELRPRPDLQVQQILAPQSASGGGTVALEFIVINQGTVPTTTPMWQDAVFLSLDNAISGDDIRLGTFTNGAALGPGEQYRTQTGSVTIPRRFRGQVFLIVRTDNASQVDEFPNDENNTLAVPLDVDPLPPSDLVLSGVVAPDQAFDGQSIEVSWTVINDGAGETDRDGWTETVWLARDRNRPSPVKPNGGVEDYLLGTFTHTGSLEVGESYEVTRTVRLPSNVTGMFFITPWTDTPGVLLQDTTADNINPDDPNEINNNDYKARPITILLTPPPDLVVDAVLPQAVGQGGAPFTVSWTVRNIGQGRTGESKWEDRVYLATSPDLSGPELALGRIPHDGALEVGQSYTAEATFDLTPAAAGTYVVVETGFGVFEGPLKDNNQGAAPTDVTNDPADFIVTSVVTPPENDSGELALIEYTVQNQGPNVWAGTQYWSDRVFISPDDVFIGHRATFLGNVTHINAGGLPSGASYTESQEFRLPKGIGGEFYIYVFTNTSGVDTDATGDNTRSLANFRSRAFEIQGNNEGSAPIAVTFREPDLVVSDLSGPAEAPTAGEDIQVGWTVTNVGTRATREGSWIDRVYLSTDASLDDGDQFLGAANRFGVLDIDGSYDRSLTVALPDGIEGDFHLLAFADSNLAGPPPPDGPSVGFEFGIHGTFARVPEYPNEGNNITALPLPVLPAEPPDLQVTDVTIPVRIAVGQDFTVTWQVTNVGTGATSDKTPRWDDLVYLSRDRFLDLSADRFLATEPHDGVLLPGERYTAQRTLRAPSGVVGEFFVMVVTDPTRNDPRGRVYEGPFETNNTGASDDPLIIELPPPADLQVVDILLPPEAKVGDPVRIEWTVRNEGTNPAKGRWSDSIYLSTDAEWDINDPFIGRARFTAPGGALAPDGTYTLFFEGTLPPARPGGYRVIVRTDIFNEVYEDLNEQNNRTPSPGTIDLTVEQLELGVPFETTLSTGQERLFEVSVGLDQALVVTVESDAARAANEIFARFDDVPSGVVFDAAYEGSLAPNQAVVVPSTQPGRYFMLVRGHAEPAADTPTTVLARVLPFGIIDVVPDVGGDSKFVTTTILGAQFKPGAIVKLVRPGIHEVEPVRFEIVDSTKIIAIFDLTDAPRGLYDVAVTNPDGETATIPYRYLVERALEPDVTVALGGPRVLAPGQTGFYGASLISRTNVDTRYTQFAFGVPELGLNGQLFNLPYVVFASNLRGEAEGPADGRLDDVPFASLVSDVNTPRKLEGEILAPGVVFDLATQQFAGRSFSAQIYEGLAEILAENPKALEGIEDEDIAFKFHLVASATSLTRDEFIAQQTIEALAMRDAILADAEAPLGLMVLAADPDNWVSLYLAALEAAQLLRPLDEAPPIREDPLVVSLMSVIATGLLVGPGGEPILADADLLEFFAQVRGWYGHDPDVIGGAAPPDFEDFDLGTSRRTHFEAFEIFVPFGEVRLDIPPGAPIAPVSFASFLEGDAAGTGGLAMLVGPFGFGGEQYLPVEQPLPYSVYFENASSAGSAAGEIRIVVPLDDDLDPRRFRLGDMRIGDIEINLPESRGAFSGQFDFAQQLGFVIRVTAGLDIPTNTAQWLIQYIDPNTGEVVQDPALGLPPNDADGSGAGFVTFTTSPLPTAATGDTIDMQARVLFNTAPPEDTQTLTQTVDAVAPVSTLTATSLSQDGADFLLEWTATDEPGGSGVQHVTVYVAEDGGDFRILLAQSTETSFVFEGEAGRTYEFLTLATDQAGNQEAPPPGIAAPDDGSRPNLGSLPDVLATTMQELGDPPPPSPQPSTNPLFLQSEAQIPQAPPSTRASEFETVISPFVARSFATGIDPSFSGIGPMAILPFDDGSVLASGGLNRGSLFRFGIEGGDAV
ncbi:MAG: hypothetical protein CMJ18_15810, partial [Phycisphaeraceae bacterium]|nr:hypothetical protein [Phycisphaeraceae bacterium]